MREIKFRAWDKYSKTMLYDFIIYSGGSWFDKYSMCCDTYHCGAQEYGIQRESSIDKNLIMQFTGLKDKNGKEIYFDDFVKAPSDNIFRVIWYDEEMRIALKHKDTIYNFNVGLYEVIGNIYENPELIK